MARQELAESLTHLFGNERVLFDQQSLQRYASGIDGSSCLPAAVVFPLTEDEIIQLVKISNDLRCTLYPISRGKNLGYGDAQGTSSGQIIVDLRKMNKIVEVNKDLCYATIQPGVSQEQLYQHIRTGNSGLQLDVTGAGLDASIVGNILERGFGHTDYGDRFARVISMNIVLPNGELIQTGFRGFGDSDAGKTYRYGLGPMLEGLFSQSNFGIITEMTIELMPRPDRTVMFAVACQDESDLPNVILAIRELKLKGIVNSAVHIANKSRTVGNKKNPFVGAWNFSGCIAGPAVLVNARKKIIRKTLRKYLRKYTLVFFGSFFVNLLDWVDRNVFKLSFYPPIREVFAEQNGIPTDEPLRTLLDDENIKSESIAIDSYQNCFSWINAVCSADSKQVSRCIDLLTEKFREKNYEFRVTMTAVNPRTLILISNITYPRNVEAISKAREFVKECHELLNKNGFLPYRSGSGAYSDLPAYSKETAALLKSIRKIVDPNNILAPGKYNLD